MGLFEHPAEILIKLLEWNRYRRVRFHTIAINYPRWEKQARFGSFMRDIAKWTGGTHRCEATEAPAQGSLRRRRETVALAASFRISIDDVSLSYP